MRIKQVVLGLAPLFVLVSCLGRESQRAPRSSGGAPDSTPSLASGAQPATSDTPPQFQAAAAVERLRQGRPVLLRAVRAAPETAVAGAYDRVTFEFADSVAGYRVGYADGPVRRCGSGDPVSLRGTAVLLVRLDPAQAHDAGGRPLPAQREMAPSLTAIKDIKLICDFEGQVQWALGVEGRAGFRVSELAAPPRLVIDVAHPR